jgi:hypothetical protein
VGYAPYFYALYFYGAFNPFFDRKKRHLFLLPGIEARSFDSALSVGFKK